MRFFIPLECNRLIEFNTTKEFLDEATHLPSSSFAGCTRSSSIRFVVNSSATTSHQLQRCCFNSKDISRWIVFFYFKLLLLGECARLRHHVGYCSCFLSPADDGNDRSTCHCRPPIDRPLVFFFGRRRNEAKPARLSTPGLFCCSLLRS